MAEPSTELVRQAQAGDERALVALVEGQQAYVYSIALSLMKNPTDAADVTQDTFIRLFRSLHTFRGDTKFTTWLYRLATNIGIDALRRRGRPVESLDWSDAEGEHPEPLGASLADASRFSQPEEMIRLNEDAAAVRTALNQLPSAQRVALTLFYFDELRYEEIADVMQVPLNTVKSHIRRAKERLAAILQENDNGGMEGVQPCSVTT